MGRETKMSQTEPDRKREYYTVPLIPPRWAVIERITLFIPPNPGPEVGWNELTHQAIAECPSESDANQILQALRFVERRQNLERKRGTGVCR